MPHWGGGLNCREERPLEGKKSLAGETFCPLNALLQANGFVS
jgi:hypothetical protein